MCGKYHGETFVPYCGVTKGSAVSPTLFNILIDAVMRKWLADGMDVMTTANTGLQGDNIGCMSSLLYTDDRAVGSLDHEWLQNANQHLCNLFRDCVGLKLNTDRTEIMSCHPGALWDWCNIDGYKRRHEGTSDSYQKLKGRGTECPHPGCGRKFVVGSLYSHCYMQHRMDASGAIITELLVLAPRL